MTSYVSVSSSLVQQWIHINASLADFYDLVSGSHLFGVRRWSTGSWTFLGDDFWMFSVSSSCWFNTGYMLLQFTEAFWVSTAENCGVSAVAVHQGRRLLLHGAQADFHGLAVRQTIGIPQLQFLNEVIDVPVVPSRSHALCVQRQVPWFVLLTNKVVHTLSSRRG